MMCDQITYINVTPTSPHSLIFIIEAEKAIQKPLRLKRFRNHSLHRLKSYKIPTFLYKKTQALNNIKTCTLKIKIFQPQPQKLQ